MVAFQGLLVAIVNGNQPVSVNKSQLNNNNGLAVTTAKEYFTVCMGNNPIIKTTVHSALQGMIRIYILQLKSWRGA